ncbi:MAG: MFS transporter [Bacteroidetes bacterium]|nr:MFS transporter [Bacteroidota bacterium]
MYKRSLVFTSACLGMLLFGIVMISLGTINTFLTSKFNLDQLTVGSLAALLPIGILVGSIFFGPIVDRYSYKSLLIICSLLIFIAFEGIAFASSFFILQLSFFLIGFGGGIINGGTNSLVADISSEGKGANLSLLGVFYGIGALGMPAVTAVLSKYYSYEAIIKGIGLIVLIPVIYFFIIKFPLPKQSQGFPIKKAFELIKESSLLLLGFILFFESGLEGSVNNWSTTYFDKTINLTTNNALFTLTVLAISLTITRLILGGLLKKIPSYIVLYSCIISGLIGSVILMFGTNFISAVIAMIFLGIGFAAAFPVILGYIGEIYKDLSGTAFSIALVIALVGNTLMNYSIGVISQSYGIQKFPIVLIASLIIMILLLSITLKKISTKTKI